MLHRIGYCLFCALCIALAFPATAHAGNLNLDRLSDKHIAQVKSVLDTLYPLIQERREKCTLATLTFDELYAPLSRHDRHFLEKFQKLSAKKLKVKIPYRGIATGKEKLVVIRGQKITVEGKPVVLPPQFLPPVVFDHYTAMMDAMERDIGKRLYIESGYRSSAYQLYLFVYYLKNHDYSIRETVGYNALVGYSEHGSPEHQAVDFINAEGINGEYDIDAFEKLPEFIWLTKNARRFGFVMSYPKSAKAGIIYEPWHWRSEP